MALSVNNLVKLRKYPFIAFLFFIILFVTFFILTTNTSQPPLRQPSVTKTIPTTPSPLPLPLPLPLQETVSNDSTETVINSELDDSDSGEGLGYEWKVCTGSLAVDYIPCLDNRKAIKALRSRRHMEHRERYCPKPNPKCLVPLPDGYKVPVHWPKSRDMIWFDNVPHLKLVEYKKEQNWVKRSGNYLLFPGGGTQFKEGVNHYIQYIEKNLPKIGWGKRTRVILDVGCGVASFGGYLLDKNVITMSFAPKDEHEAQIQFALERGIPATLSVIGTQRLTFPDNAFDLIHCARCRVHWDGYGGKPLLELNRVLRPGGVFIWSATPVYRDDERDKKVWKAMVALTESICWKVVAKSFDSSGIGLVIYEKPVSSSCYKSRKENNPPLCDENTRPKTSWYTPLDGCISAIPITNTWPTPWPQRLNSKPLSLSTDPEAERVFHEDTKHWSELVTNVYIGSLGVNWSNVRNVMDMNVGYGGFAAALSDLPLWVMNIVSVNGPDTLPVIFDRGLIGIYHDWCESLNTYPRTYDLLHSSFLFGNVTHRCDVLDVVVEMDRILRPGGVVIVEDNIQMLNKLKHIFRSLHWSTSLHQQRFLVGRKGFWRPETKR
ncbi:putative S-adenosyl-L-methionine-dependent methyltransferase [Helianthus annuus]|uniref:Methyltransferase n=1 Tax=Helianthus annuus TaxID=4232 RepID=A0A251SMC5_HELAN|nr:probable methyltransferase PMT23 [Helianthus annuus]KAF5771039.1 putative S-adenosyl-L-methionine-dependent methyltransferase [Helianthus annuus]KAJ0465898.1 putative S-adenosyl-L-methionine-dependent methyltransferase [Helianthus annuus]KAJ0487474.1 putative S-adenosyl-L-methionine-dependent methyltransferase [Helianthus annuus]KAJ0657913.1 putative S-adenosyl-L-methionine-dependent methyltransferase [Helianthus annuus]KAJ0661596.1 putative S-adenosyl-L-methionine-dependent methyltransfera